MSAVALQERGLDQEAPETAEDRAFREFNSKARSKKQFGPPPWPEKPLWNPKPRQVYEWWAKYLPADFVLLQWYRKAVSLIYGSDLPSEIVISIGQGNGKTMLAAALGVFELLGRGIRRAQVLFLATSLQQAWICYDQALDLISRSPLLAPWTQRAWTGGFERREVPRLGAYMMPLPTRNPKVLKGYTPMLAVVDETGFVTPASWSAMQNAVTKRRGAKVLGIGTPGFDEDGTMYRLRTLAREVKPPGLRYFEWAAPNGCDLRDRRAWRHANPAIREGIKPIEQMAKEVETTPEDEFRRFQLGQWVGRSDRWLRWGAWGNLRRVEAPAAGERIALGFDGSATRDATALCWATREAVGVVKVWERIGEPTWEVPRRQVVETILTSFECWDVTMLACDPAGWRSEIQEIEREVGSRVHKVNFSGYTEFAPACDRFYQAVMGTQLLWDGSEVLTRHVSNAVPVATRYGTAIEKSNPDSKDHIDAAVAAIIAYEWAWRTLQPERPLDVASVIG